jgi:hypothetical protein
LSGFNKEELYNVCGGMPVACTDNVMDIEWRMHNTQMYALEKISGREAVIKENKTVFPMDGFKACSTLGLCVTVCRYQGDKIDTHYIIHDASHMGEKQMYTALSRTTEFEYTHVSGGLKDKYTYTRTSGVKQIKQAQTRYKNGTIYQVDLGSGFVYIESTKCTLEKRFAKHVNDQNSVVYMNKIHKPKTSLLCDCPCLDEELLETHERYHINKFA